MYTVIDLCSKLSNGKKYKTRLTASNAAERMNLVYGSNKYGHVFIGDAACGVHGVVVNRPVVAFNCSNNGQ